MRRSGSIKVFNLLTYVRYNDITIKKEAFT